MNDDIVPVAGTGPDLGGRGLYAEWDQQWSCLFGRCSWYDFTLIKIQGEFAPYSGRWEFDLGLLGITLRLTYVYDDTFNRDLQTMVTALKSDRVTDADD